MRPDEQELIIAFVGHLGVLKGQLNLSVDRWPDKENRTEPEIDAIAGDLAIEHTSIDSVANQRRLNDWYLRVIKNLDQVIRDCVDCGLTITLDFYAIGKGMDWSRIRADLESWIVGYAQSLEYGSHDITLPTSMPTEFPIVMRVWKKSVPSIIGFSRLDPEDDTLSVRIGKLLDKKATKLRKYHGSSGTTIILVENDDIALMNEAKMLDALREAYPDGLPQGVDQVWFADTSISDKPQFHDFTPNMVNDDYQPSLGR